MNDNLPIHIHVKNADGEARCEVENVRLIESKGIKPKDLILAEALIEERKEEIIKNGKMFLINNFKTLSICK